MSVKQHLKKVLNTKKIKSFINFYCDFETVIFNNKHYVTCYSLVNKDYQFTDIIDLKTSDELIEKSNFLVLDFINHCLNLVKQNKKKHFLFFFRHKICLLS